MGQEFLSVVLCLGLPLCVFLLLPGAVFGQRPAASESVERTNMGGAAFWTLVIAAVGTWLIYASHGATPL